MCDSTKFYRFNLDKITVFIDPVYVKSDKVMFPLFNANFMYDKGTKSICILLDEFENILFFVKHNNPNIVENIIFPDYLEVVYEYYKKKEVYLFLDTDDHYFDNSLAFLQEFCFEFI